MSEAMSIPPLGGSEQKRTPTVYFIDDSATMREVIKIAFRRENINVITCADAASALAQFEQNRPDAVITDVIMPDQDGYSVCAQIRQHPEFSATPVVLMSGVVNKAVADKAVSVKADELIRKPFQPQELIARVKSLLEPKSEEPASAPEKRAVSNSLSSLFAPLPDPSRNVPPPLTTADRESAWSPALADSFTSKPNQSAGQALRTYASPSGQPVLNQSDVRKLQVEIARLNLLVKKLQTELQVEREYNQALEAQIRSLTVIE